jgi:hypothetical protein
LSKRVTLTRRAANAMAVQQPCNPPPKTPARITILLPPPQTAAIEMLYLRLIAPRAREKSSMNFPAQQRA